MAWEQSLPHLTLKPTSLLDREMRILLLFIPWPRAHISPCSEYPALHLRHFGVSTMAKENTFLPLLLCILANILSKELCSKNSGNTCQQRTWELCLNKCTCQLSSTVDFARLKTVDYFKTSLMDNRNWTMEMRHGMCLESCLSFFFVSFSFLTLSSLSLVQGHCNVNVPLALSPPCGRKWAECLGLNSSYLAKTVSKKSCGHCKHEALTCTEKVSWRFWAYRFLL